MYGSEWKKTDSSHPSINSSMRRRSVRSHRIQRRAGDLILIAADRPKVVFDTLGFLRRHIAFQMGIVDENRFDLLWVTDFPMFEKDDETGEVKAMHHPFTHPKDEDIPLLDTDPMAVKADAYDIVLNGVELGGGSLRIHERDLQQKMFDILGISKEDSQRKFGFLLEAFKYGVPPHGGLAYGLDRFIMLLTNRTASETSWHSRRTRMLNVWSVTHLT